MSEHQLLTKLPILPKLSKYQHRQVFLTTWRCYLLLYLTNNNPLRETPISLISPLSPRLSAEDTSPAEAGAWGWVRFGIAFP